LIVRPETILRWHRQGFRLYWRWKSRRAGRPDTAQEIRALIRKMCLANPTWGASRIHGELLKLGIEVSQTTVLKYMVRQPKPPSQSWRTFLDNHIKQLVSIDFFVVPTINFRLMFVFLVLAHDRRRVIHFNVTEHPTAAWTANKSCRLSPGTLHLVAFFGIATLSMAKPFADRSQAWKSAKYSRRHNLHGKVPMSSY